MMVLLIVFPVALLTNDGLVDSTPSGLHTNYGIVESAPSGTPY